MIYAMRKSDLRFKEKQYLQKQDLVYLLVMKVKAGANPVALLHEMVTGFIYSSKQTINEDFYSLLLPNPNVIRFPSARKSRCKPYGF
jgi:hypothetical protein